MRALRTISLTKNLDDHLKQLRDRRGISISRYMVLALEAKLKADGLAQTETENE